MDKERKGGQEGTRAREDRKTYDFHDHCVLIISEIFEQRNEVSCMFAVPAELRVIQIGIRNDSRKASQNDNNPGKS